MTEYGHMIDSDLVEDKRSVYDIFVSFFGNPKLTKIKDENNCSVYAAKVNLHLREERYLIVICKQDNFTMGTNFDMEALRWDSLQTRSLNQELPCNVFTYMPSKKYPFASRIFLKERGEKMTTYTSRDYKISLCLLHTENTKYQYPNLSTIAAALETFQTIVQIET